MFSNYDDVVFVVVGEVAECGNMFRGEHGASAEGADDEGLQGRWELDWVGYPHRVAVWR